MKNRKIFRLLTNGSKQYNQLYLSLVLSFVCVFISLACLASFTYAWFSTQESTKTNNVDAGVIAIELSKSNNSYEPRIEINAESPLFTSEDSLELGGEIIKELVVSNHGTLTAEYNIGIKVEAINTDESEGETGDISKLIDVFMVKVDETSKEIDTYLYEDQEVKDIEKYVYLGTLDYINTNKNYENDNRIVVKGILDPQYDLDDEEDEENKDYEDYYSLKFKMKEKAEAKYQNCNIRISMELVSNKKVDDLCTITALSNNDEYGLVLGGGTYYIDGEHKVELIPQAKEGYKFQKWLDVDDGIISLPEVVQTAEGEEYYVVTDSDKTYLAIFVKANEYEEDIDDPWGDEPEDVEDFPEQEDDVFGD